LDFHVLDCTANNEGFDDLLKKNSFAFQTTLKNFQHYNYFNNFQDKLNISGNSNPLFKVGLPRIDEISPFTLARLLGFHNQTYAIDRISKWLDQTQPYAEKYNIHIVTLFYWEIRFGNWAPMFNTALDLSTEEFAPFNCRKMISLILGLDDKYRMPSNMLIYQEMIKTLWPEVLLEPVNPGRYGLLKKIKTAFINNTFILLKRIGMYNIIRTIFRKLMRHK
jgi:hypothetical protein